jgi:ABC-type antimicrobial peptide transport system permease subunit
MLSEALRREVREMDSRIPLRIETVSDRIRASLVRERVTAILATGLGLVALALACAALYGLLAYAVSRQSHEIGLRIALGADRPSVLRLVLRECLVMTLAGTVLGVGASLALGRYAASLLYEISPRDPGAVTVSAALMMTVALLAALVPARRAMLIDPVVALRQD